MPKAALHFESSNYRFVPEADARSMDILDTSGYKNNSEFGGCSYGKDI